MPLSSSAHPAIGIAPATPVALSAGVSNAPRDDVPFPSTVVPSALSLVALTAFFLPDGACTVIVLLVASGVPIRSLA